MLTRNLFLEFVSEFSSYALSTAAKIEEHFFFPKLLSARRITNDAPRFPGCISVEFNFDYSLGLPGLGNRDCLK